MSKLPPVLKSYPVASAAENSHFAHPHASRLHLVPQTERDYSPTRTPSPSLPVALLKKYSNDWLYDCEYRQHTKRTMSEKRGCIEKLHWFLDAKGCTECGTVEIKRFLAYVTNGHLEPGGRWGNPKLTTPVRPITVRGYYRYLQSLFNWLVIEEVLEVSPMARVSAPIVRQDRIQPFSRDQIEAIIMAARRTKYPLRNEAMVRFLYDTGVRAQEFCDLHLGHIDLLGRSAQIVKGKGNKKRVVYFSIKSARILRRYISEENRLPDEPLFQSERGSRAGQPLTRSGLLQQIEALGKMAGIQGVRCSPHTFRHSFAVDFLMDGGEVFALKELLGHSTLQMTLRYVNYSDANIEGQYRKHSLGDRLKV